MQGGLVRRKLSVRPSVKHVHCDKMEERSVLIFRPFERSLSLVFWKEEWLVEATPSTWNFGSAGLHLSEIADFEPIFARNASAITPSKKVQLTLTGSPLHASQWA